MRNLRGRLSIAAVAALAVTLAARADHGGWFSWDGIPPWEVQFRGTLDSRDGARLRIGANTVVLPADSRNLLLDDNRHPDPDYLWVEHDLRRGRMYVVDGSLRQDGTVLAYDFHLVDDDYLDTIGGPESLFPEAATGICDAADATSLSIDGTALEIVPDGPGVVGDEALVGRGGTQVDYLPRVGDVVSASFVRAPDGRLFAQLVDPVRPSGTGTRVDGTIRAVDFNDPEGEGAGTFDVDGVTVAFTYETWIFCPEDPDQENGYFDPYFQGERPVIVGRVASVRGVLGDGIVYAERIDLGRAPRAGKRGWPTARRVGRLLANGVVTSRDAGTVAVNDLAMRFGARGEAPPLGQRVRASARLSSSGIVATSVRTR